MSGRDFEAEYTERQAKAAAERAAWPERYPIVARMIARGFWPDAYGYVAGDRDDPATPVYRPPTKFFHPGAGIDFPHHGGGEGAGYNLLAFTHTDAAFAGEGSLDEVAAMPVWSAGWHASTGHYYIRYSAHGLTLDQAAALCEAFGEHHRRHFITPDWRPGPDNARRLPVLPARDWWELAALQLHPTAAPEPAQLALFADPPAKPVSQAEQLQQEIAVMVADAGPLDELMLWCDDMAYELNHLVSRANTRRAETRDVPPPPMIASLP